LYDLVEGNFDYGNIMDVNIVCELSVKGYTSQLEVNDDQVPP
jgi:hypothetical protein